MSARRRRSAFVATDKEDGGSFNRVVGVDARFTWDKIYSLAMQGAASSERVNTAVHHRYAAGNASRVARGPMWDAHFVRAGRGPRSQLRSERHRSASGRLAPGFVSRAGVVTTLTADNRYHVLLRAGRISPDHHAGFHLQNIWTYRQLHRWRPDRGPEVPLHRRSRRCSAAGSSRAAIFLEHFGYDPQLYRTTSWVTSSGGTTHVHALRRHRDDPQHRLRVRDPDAGVRAVRLQAQLSHVPRRELLRVGVGQHQ